MDDLGNEPVDPIRSAPETASRVLRDPQSFFATLPREGGYEAPAIFAGTMLLAYGVILALFALIGLGPAGFFYALIIVPILAGIGLLVAAAIVFFASQALGGEATFESSFRIVAYASAIAPIGALVSFIPYAPLLANAYGIYLTIVAVIAVNRVPEGRAWRILGGIGAVLLLLAFFATMASRRMEPALERWGAEMEKSAVEMERAGREWQRQMEKMAEEMERRGD
jgi:hypothetical protein